jgi:hypothetical protein
MQLSNLKFTFEDFVKLAGFMVTFLVGYYNLVSEIRENKIVNNADKVIINFRLDKIESRLNISDVPSSVAILPSQPNVPKKDDE